MQKSLAARLRVLRARKGLTLLAASEELGIDRHTLRDLELGRGRTPRYPTLAKIAEGYDVPVEDLLEKEPVPLDDAPQETGPLHHVRMPHDSMEVSDEVKQASVRLEKVRQILDARDAGKLDDVDADKEIQREYQQEDPAA
jgi:transcriptional regulator with XRE-family HTH domain